MRLGVGAGSLLVDTNLQDRGQVIRNQPTGHTPLPSRQSGSSVADAQSSSPWQHTQAVVPSNQQLPASCLAGNRDWEPPRWQMTGQRKTKYLLMNKDITIVT